MLNACRKHIHIICMSVTKERQLVRTAEPAHERECAKSSLPLSRLARLHHARARVLRACRRASARAARAAPKARAAAQACVHCHKSVMPAMCTRHCHCSHTKALPCALPLCLRSRARKRGSAVASCEGLRRQGNWYCKAATRMHTRGYAARTEPSSSRAAQVALSE